MSVELDFPRMIRTYVTSVWALELILVMRSDASRWWRPEELSDKMKATVDVVDTSLKHFRRLGLVVTNDSGRYRFAPISPLLRAFCEQLSDEIRERPVSTINLIAAPEDRIQQLAVAFHFRRRKPH
jgi:hypothetical protein